MISLKGLPAILYNNLWLILLLILIAIIFFILIHKTEKYTDADYFEHYEPVDARELIDKKLDPSSFKLVEIDRTMTTEEFEDENKELKAFLTDFVNQEFLSDNKNIFTILELIFNNYNETLSEYKKKMGLRENDIIFAFKGGNIFRVINLNIQKELPGYVSDIIATEFDKYFKRSDNDFSIYVNYDLPNYQQVYDQVSILSYYILQNINNIFSSKLDEYFKIFTLNDKLFAQKFANLTKTINQSLGTTYKSIKLIERKDIYVRREGDYNITYSIENSESSFFYNSLNTALEFQQGKFLTKFDLARTKISFEILASTDKKISSGELTDVSLPHRDDTEMKNIMDKYTFDDFVMSDFAPKLHFSPENTKYSFDYRIVNSKYLIEDLMKVIFSQKPNPWSDPKYEKRVARLIYLIFINYIETQGLNQNSMEKICCLVGETIQSLHKISYGYYPSPNLNNIYLEDLIHQVLLLSEKQKGVEFEKFISRVISEINDVETIIRAIQRYMDDPKIYGSIYKLTDFA